MKQLQLLFLCLSILILPLRGFTQNDYYPLEKGKEWTYKYSEDFKSASGAMSKIQILKVSEQINGKDYFVIQTSIGDEGHYDVLQTSYLRNGTNGQVLGLASKESTNEDILIDSQPLSLGQSWKAESSGQSSVSTIVSISEDLITPDKTFKNCLVIETEMADAKIRSYFQKGKGLIASSLIIPEGEKLMQYMVE